MDIYFRPIPLNQWDVNLCPSFLFLLRTERMQRAECATFAIQARVNFYITGVFFFCGPHVWLFGH